MGVTYYGFHFCTYNLQKSKSYRKYKEKKATTQVMTFYERIAGCSYFTSSKSTSVTSSSPSFPCEGSLAGSPGCPD